MDPYFRPPEGRFDRRSLESVSKLGYKTIFWSIAYVDWYDNKEVRETDYCDRQRN